VKAGEDRHEWLCASCEYLREHPDAPRFVKPPRERAKRLQKETLLVPFQSVRSKMSAMRTPQQVAEVWEERSRHAGMVLFERTSKAMTDHEHFDAVCSAYKSWYVSGKWTFERFAQAVDDAATLLFPRPHDRPPRNRGKAAPYMGWPRL
jgi:hypothetical protein